MLALNEERSRQLRRDTIALSKANGGYHYGGSFSCVEILAILYDEILKYDDRFILSKGHACWPWYVLLREKGFNPKLEGHPSRDTANGILCTTGSEGHGFPTAVGMAMAKKIKGEPGRVFVLVGDGECQEGTTWESMLTGAFRELDNLVVIVDWNEIQGSGFVRDILPIDGLGKVAETLGWDVFYVNGHSYNELRKVLFYKKSLLSNIEALNGKPLFIIAYTIKGRGVSYMENNPAWHANWPDPEHEAKALEELA